MSRVRREKTEYEKSLARYRKNSQRHVLIIEADMSEDLKRHTFSLSDELRVCGNNLTAKLSKSMKQLFRDKKYKALQKAYGIQSEKKKADPDNKDITKNLKSIAGKMSALQEKYHVTWDDARSYMAYLKEDYGINSIFALARAEDIWSGVEKVLFGNAKNIHFKERGCLPEIRAKQINRGIVLSVRDGKLYFSCADISDNAFSYIEPDKFQNDELKEIIKYLRDPDAADKCAVEIKEKTGEIINTYRPCYVSLVCKKIRGKLRVYIHITVEGLPVRKYKSDGITPRHEYGKGRVGADIGTQTVAYTSDKEVGLKNLCERGGEIRHIERQERVIQRKMDRSRRATNPECYNPDGTIRKGRKKWVYSKHYIKLRARHKEMCRKIHDSHVYAINEDVNHLRSLGDEFVTEQPNFKALQKKAKPSEPTINADGSKKYKRRKRFGKSLKNRSPGTFQSSAKQKFERTGGTWYEVDKMYRASQYDHTADNYIKKKLSQRIYNLSDGTKVQRDWYSSFLIYNANNDYSKPDRSKCIKTFKKLYDLQTNMINNIKKSRIRVLNSGIAV